jgi:hypothetical protein
VKLPFTAYLGNWKKKETHIRVKQAVLVFVFELPSISINLLTLY